MEEVIDLTFDSGDDSPPKRRTPRRTAAPSPDDHNLLASPLRRMLAVQSGNHQRAAPSQAERPAASKPTRPQLHANPIPTLDDLDLDTGLAARLHASAGHEAAPGPPDPPAARPRRSRQERSRQAAAGIAPPLSVRMPASAYASNGASLPPSQAGEETWGEGPSQWEADAPAAKKTRRPRMTAEEKQAAAERKAAEAAAKKQLRQYNSATHVLRFVTVVLDPEVMTGPLGLKIAAVFQDTRSKPESDQIHYKVAPAGLDGLPAIKWLRKVPATEHGTVLGLGRAGSSGGESLDGACGPEELLIDAEEPNVLLCFDAEDFATRVQRDSLASVYSTLQRHCPGHMPHFLVLRLEQYLQKRERADHKRAMTAAAGSSFAAEGFQRRPVDDFLARMLVECPHAAFRDVGSPEEGAAHVVSLTKAVAERYIAAAGDAAVYLSGRAGNKSAKGTAASLLASFPIQDQSVRTLMHALTALPSVGPQIAHVVASKYGSLGALIEFLFDPGTLPAQKIAEIEHLQRPGGQGAKRVGPKAARQIFDVLTGSNPDVLMHGSGD